MTDRFLGLPASFRESEAGQNAAQLLALRESYKTTDPADLWREFGVIRRENDGRYAVLAGERGSGGDLVFCFHDQGESAADAECYGFAHLAHTTGLTVVCPEGPDPSAFPRILSELKGAGMSFRRVFAFGKGAGGVAAARCAASYPSLVDGVCGAFALRALLAAGLTAEAGVPRKAPVLLLGGTEDGVSPFPLADGESRESFRRLLRSLSGVQLHERRGDSASTVERALGVGVHKGYYAMVEGTIWTVADWYAADGRPALRVMKGLGIPRVITGAIAPLAYSFFTQSERVFQQTGFSRRKGTDTWINESTISPPTT